MKINNAEIFVETIKGKGNFNFVLIHNAGGDHRFFTHQIETLKKYGNIIQLDLPGHGKSVPISNYAMSDLANIVIEICKALALENICLIGLNNGGNIILEILNMGTLPIKNIVLIDPPIFMGQSFINEINHSIQLLENAQSEEFVNSLVKAIFIQAESSSKEIARSAFMSADNKSLQKVFRGLIEWDSHSKGIFQKIHCQGLCILTDEHHCSYKKLSEEAPNIEIAKVIGSKCWATLEVPQQVNAIIERFLFLTTS